MTAPLSPREEDRLQTLARYRVLGTEPEPAFDRLTRLAARLFQTPMAGISLLGEKKQWMKSCYGLDFREVDRQDSFAAHAILLPPGEEVFCVPDATLDPRFADNPLVTGGPRIRFFAGAPLRAPGGHVLGCFGVLDTTPRVFSAADRAALLDLAATTMDALELRHASLRQQEEAAERHRAEDASRRSESILREIAANAPGMVYQYVRNQAGASHFAFVGEGCREFYGVDPAGLYAQPTLIREVLTPEALTYVIDAHEQSARTLGPCDFEMPYRAPDGSTRWMQGMSRPTRLPDGSTLWNGMLLDVTERKRTQQKLEDSHILLSAVINGTTDAVFVRDVESRYLLINPAGAAFLGVSVEDVVGQTDDRFFDAESVRKNREHDLNVIRSGSTLTYEDSDVLEGERRAFLSTKTPFRDAAGKLVGVIGVAREITEQQRAAQALREAKEEAERANRAKSEFLSRMSHELRTPLNAILGFGQVLEMHPMPSNETEGVSHILKAGRHLLKLIDEVLAISRIEAGHLNLSAEAVELGGMVDECLHLVASMARERGIRCDKPGGTNAGFAGTYVMADRQRLRQVLLNLLSNAIKYNRPGGSVRLSYAQTPAVREEPARLRLEVSDTGIGLGEEEIPRLFTPFERLKAERSATEGTGLGLALSKGLIEAMGGTVGVRSRLGEGSVFWVELPAAAHPLPDAGWPLPESRAQPGEGCQGTVLYIEDNLSNFRLIEMLLARHANVELLGSTRGALGLEIARRRLPDLILLDLHLPDLPGWDVLAALQADAATREIPVIAVSADATANQIARLRQAGVRDYVTKPFEVPALLEIVREHLKGRTESVGQ